MSDLPRAYAQLLPHLDIIHPSVLSEAALDRIKKASSYIVSLRHNIQAELLDSDDEEMLAWAMQILDTLQDVEEVGVEGWVRWLDESERREVEGYERYSRGLGGDGSFVEGIISGDVDGLGEFAAGLRVYSEDEYKRHTIGNEQEGENIQELRRLTENLQTRLSTGNGVRRHETEAIPTSGLRGLPNIYEEGGGDAGSMDSQRGSPDRTISSMRDSGRESSHSGTESEEEESKIFDLPRTTQKTPSTIVEVGSRTSEPRSSHANPHSPCLDTPSIHETSYPPPLTTNPSQNDNRYVELFENNERRWAKEEEERTHDLNSDTCTFLRSAPQNAEQKDKSLKYVYFLLPSPFTIPNHDAHSCTLTFRCPVEVFHFPRGATRDRLLGVLKERKQMGLEGLEIGEGDVINVIRVRTQGMECELKNAIARSLSVKEKGVSGLEGMRIWGAEGKGNTYIVSVSDIYFHGISRVREEEEEEEEGDGDGGRWGGRPHLRGGAGTEESDPYDGHSVPVSSIARNSTRFPAPQDEFDQDANSWTPTTLEEMRTEYLATHFPLPTHKENMSWMQEAHALQRKVNYLQYELENLRKDYAEAAKTNETRMRNPYHLHNVAVKEIGKRAREQNKSFDEVYVALKKEYNSSVAAQQTSQLDGGQNDTTNTPKPTPQSSTYNEPSTHDISATGFYFFPSVSTVVLLTSPLTYFEYPRHTTLVQLRQILRHRRATGIEDDANLVRVHEILEIRDEMGIPDPDLSDGRMVLISLPESAEDGEGEAPFWEQRMGESWDMYVEGESKLKEVGERIRRRGLKSGDRSHLSPRNSEYGYSEIGDLIRELDAQSEEKSSTSGASDNNEPYTHKAPPRDEYNQPCHAGAVHLRGGASGTNPPSPSPISHTPPLVDSHMFTAWKVVHPPEDETVPELDRSANFDYEQPPDGTRATPCSPIDGPLSVLEQATPLEVTSLPRDVGLKDEWRHGKGEGCETWSGFMDPFRTNCTFCYAPFQEGQRRESSSIPSRDTYISPAPLHGPRSSNVSPSNSNSDEDPVIPRLRGGGGGRPDPPSPSPSPPRISRFSPWSDPSTSPSPKALRSCMSRFSSSGSGKRVRFCEIAFRSVPSPTMVGGYADPLTHKHESRKGTRTECGSGSRRMKHSLDPPPPETPHKNPRDIYTQPSENPEPQSRSTTIPRKQPPRSKPTVPKPPIPSDPHDSLPGRNWARTQLHTTPIPMQAETWQGLEVPSPLSQVEARARAGAELRETKEQMARLREGLARGKENRKENGDVKVMQAAIKEGRERVFGEQEAAKAERSQGNTVQGSDESGFKGKGKGKERVYGAPKSVIDSSHARGQDVQGGIQAKFKGNGKGNEKESWIPPTVAGPSKPFIPPPPKIDPFEYDGMIWDTLPPAPDSNGKGNGKGNSKGNRNGVWII